MRRRRSSFPLFLLSLFVALGACATVPSGPTSGLPDGDAGAGAAVAGTQAESPATTRTASSQRRRAATTEPASLPAVSLDAEVLYELLVAEIAIQRKQYDVALRNYLHLARTTRDPRIAGMAARVAIYSRQNRQALEAARLWVQLAPQDLEARQAVIAAYIRNGRMEEALPHIDFLLDQGGEAENGLRLLTSLLSRERDVQSALQVMKHVMATRGDNPQVLLSYGHLALRSGDLGAALTAIEQALELRPGWTEALLLKARLLQLRDGRDAALDLLARAVSEYKNDVRLRLAYARLLMDAKRYEEALQEYRFLSTLAPENGDLHFTTGLLLMQLKRYEEADQVLRSLRRRGVRFDEINFYLGWIAENRGDDRAAIDYYRAVTGGPNYLEAVVRLAILLGREGELDEARRLLQRTRAEAPAHRQRLYLMEGEILREAKQYEAAMAVFTEALEEFPADTSLRYVRAIVAERLDRLDLMEKDLLRILEREPDNADALNALGYTLADRTDRYEEAYRYIKRALELRPDSHAILDSMGWVLYRMGQYDEAIKYLRLSLQIKMDDEVAAHLGEVLWVSGRQEEALKVWNEALEQFTDNELLLNVIKRFSH